MIKLRFKKYYFSYFVKSGLKGSKGEREFGEIGSFIGYGIFIKKKLVKVFREILVNLLFIEWVWVGWRELLRLLKYFRISNSGDCYSYRYEELREGNSESWSYGERVFIGVVVFFRLGFLEMDFEGGFTCKLFI